jgi:hypothetical protein
LGGLSKLNVYYQSYVEQVYGNVLNIHIAAFALTSVNLLIFLVFILRPFMNKVRPQPAMQPWLLCPMHPCTLNCNVNL